jgi:hypothetical protein
MNKIEIEQLKERIVSESRALIQSKDRSDKTGQQAHLETIAFYVHRLEKIESDWLKAA